MKYSLADELKIIKEIRRGEMPEPPGDFKPDEAKTRRWAQNLFDSLPSPVIVRRPDEYRPGQVWLTKSINPAAQSVPFEPKAFILTFVHREQKSDVISIGGVPISEEWRFATPSDLVVVPGEGMPACFGRDRVMIQLELETSIPAEAMSAYLGEVSAELFSKIQTMLTWLDGKEVEREFLDAETVTSENGAPLGPPMERWLFNDPVTGQVHRVLLGQQMVGKESVRIEYKKMELEDLNCLAGLIEDLNSNDSQDIENKAKLTLDKMNTKLAELTYIIGEDLKSEGKLEEAAEFYRNAIEDAQGDPDLIVYLGWEFFDHGKFQEAESAFRRAAELAPEEPMFHLNLGWALSEQKKFQEAELAFRKAIGVDPDGDWLEASYESLGEALLYQGKYRDAESALREAIEINPETAWDNHLLGRAIFNQGKYQDAESVFREAIHLLQAMPASHKRNSRVYTNESSFFIWLSRAILNQGRHEEAGPFLIQALELAADNDSKSIISFLLAKKSLLQKLYNEAESYLKKAEDLLELKKETKDLFSSIIDYSRICKFLKEGKLDIEDVKEEIESEKPFESILEKFQPQPELPREKLAHGGNVHNLREYRNARQVSQASKYKH